MRQCIYLCTGQGACSKCHAGAEGGRGKAKELIRENDQMLHARYKQMTGSNRGARHNRHMLIDSSVLGVEETAKYIEEFVVKALAKTEDTAEEGR